MGTLPDMYAHQGQYNCRGCRAVELDVVAPRLSKIGDNAFAQRSVPELHEGQIVIRGSLRHDLEVSETAFHNFHRHVAFEHRDCSSVPDDIQEDCSTPCGDGHFADAFFSSKYLQIPGRPDLALELELPSQQKQMYTAR